MTHAFGEAGDGIHRDRKIEKQTRLRKIRWKVYTIYGNVETKSVWVSGFTSIREAQ